MNDTVQRKSAIEFVDLWKGKGDEKQETQQFWSDLLHRVFGIVNFSSRVQFEKRVPLLHTSFIDVFIPETKVIVEQKSMDIDLLKRKKQSDGSELNPFEQAQRYGSKLPYSERPRWIVTCNFQKFIIYDMEEMRPEEHPVEILLEELPDKYHLLSFLIDPTIKKITVEQELSFQAGELVGKLYDLMLPLYKDPSAESTLQSLNKFCVRIVFCLYAEDAMLFGNKGSEFHDYLANESNTRMALIRLFRILDQQEADRDPYTEQILLDFPYVNGGLFSGDIEIPQITDEIKNLILEDMSAQLDWSKISPTIFGAVFESTLNPETRRQGGMHYTSLKDIHKVIDPLFLDDLQTELDNILHDSKLSKPKRLSALQAFQERLAKLYFLDPACGSGNFLTETFLSLRRMENRVIENQLKGQMVLEFANPVKVSIGQFAGIEINDFAVTVARTALWIAESQMIKETETIVNQTIEFFPLKTDAKIVEGNALYIDWNEIVLKYKLTYIMGNPPFNGTRTMTDNQKKDVANTFTKKWNSYKSLDYVTCWYKVTAEFIQGTKIKASFVSTNSIIQGEQPPILWKPLFQKYNIEIDYAYTTFEWNSEASDMAHVHCVIIGFSAFHSSKQKKIYNDDGTVIDATNINAWLKNRPSVFVERKEMPISNVPNIYLGCTFNDNNHLIFTEEEKDEIIKNYPDIEQFIYPYIMGKDFINKKPRYCLWFVNTEPAKLKKFPFILDLINKVRLFRLNCKNPDTYASADTPYLPSMLRYYSHNNYEDYLAIPKVSSQRRRYIPMDMVKGNVIAGDKIFLMPKGELYHFGILESIVHMIWVKEFCGRLKSDFSYSSKIVYNTFPWPISNEQQKKKIEQTAQAILDARSNHLESSLSALYEPLTMPNDLLKAHKANDRAVMEAYGMWNKVHTEEDCIRWLLKMYEELTKTEGE